MCTVQDSVCLRFRQKTSFTHVLTALLLGQQGEKHDAEDSAFHQIVAIVLVHRISETQRSFSRKPHSLFHPSPSWDWTFYGPSFPQTLTCSTSKRGPFNHPLRWAMALNRGHNSTTKTPQREKTEPHLRMCCGRSGWWRVDAQHVVCCTEVEGLLQSSLCVYMYVALGWRLPLLLFVDRPPQPWRDARAFGCSGPEVEECRSSGV